MLLGWCTRCKRFRYVRVTNLGLVALQQHGIAQGVCAECERDADKERER